MLTLLLLTGWGTDYMYMCQYCWIVLWVSQCSAQLCIAYLFKTLSTSMNTALTSVQCPHRGSGDQLQWQLLCSMIDENRTTWQQWWVHCQVYQSAHGLVPCSPHYLGTSPAVRKQENRISLTVPTTIQWQSDPVAAGAYCGSDSYVLVELLKVLSSLQLSYSNWECTLEPLLQYQVSTGHW